MPPIRGVIFDLDGTLIDSLPDLADGINVVRRQFGLAALPETEVRGYIGDGAAKLVERSLHDRGPEVVEEAVGRFLNWYGENLCNRTTLFPETDELIQILLVRGMKLGVATNKPERFARPILDALGVGQHFSMILGGDSLPRRKPDPLMLNHMLERWMIPPEACVMIGDAVNDIRVGKAAGTATIGVRWGYRPPAELEEAQPDAMIKDWDGLLAWLGEREHAG